MNPRPTLKHVAAAAGVSAMTVSLSLRNSPRISEKTKTKIQAIAAKMGYQQNSFAASLVSFRTSSQPKYQATIALINCYNSRSGWRQYAAFKNFFEGASERAQELGYSLEEFWMNDPSLTAGRLRRTLNARGIPAMLMAFLEEGHQSVDKLHAFDFTGFASATIGWRMDDLNIHSASNDQFHTASLATQRLLNLGYRRIGLILNEMTDLALEHRYRAGFIIHQLELPEADRVPIFNAQELTKATFVKWVRDNRIDAVLAAPAGVHQWLEQDGMSIPEDIGFAYLDRITPGGNLAGIDQMDRSVASAAVDIVVAQLHRNENGLAPYQKSLLIRGKWIDGWSVKPVNQTKVDDGIQLPPTGTGEKSVKGFSPKRARSKASKVNSLGE